MHSSTLTLILVAIVVFAVALSFSFWIARRRQPKPHPHRIEAAATARGLGYAPGTEAWDRFIAGYVGGSWFVDSKQGNEAVRLSYGAVMAMLRAEPTHYDIGWAYAVRPAYLRAAGSRHERPDPDMVRDAVA